MPREKKSSHKAALMMMFNDRHIEVMTKWEALYQVCPMARHGIGSSIFHLKHTILPRSHKTSLSPATAFLRIYLEPIVEKRDE